MSKKSIAATEATPEPDPNVAKIAALYGQWQGAVKALLGKTQTVEIDLPDGSKAKQERHETDPPENMRLPRGMRRPGGLPTLVLEAEIDKKAITEKHDHQVGHAPDADLLKHLAHVVVVEARRIHAKGLALREPVVKDGAFVLTVVLVKGP